MGTLGVDASWGPRGPQLGPQRPPSPFWDDGPALLLGPFLNPPLELKCPTLVGISLPTVSAAIPVRCLGQHGMTAIYRSQVVRARLWWQALCKVLGVPSLTLTQGQALKLHCRFPSRPEGRSYARIRRKYGHHLVAQNADCRALKPGRKLVVTVLVIA